MRRKVLAVAILPLPLMALIAALSIWELTRVQETAHWVDHTGQVLSQIYLAERLQIDQETGLRGFILTGNQAFLEPYQEGLQRYNGVIQHLRELISDNPAQQQRIDAVQQAHAAWLKAAQDDMAAKPQTARSPGLEQNMLQRKISMDRVRAVMLEISDQERALLEQRRSQADATGRNAIVYAAVGLTIAGIFLVWLMRKSIREIDRIYHVALEGERRSRAAAEALAREVSEQSEQMEALYREVRKERDLARQRVAELERSR